MHLPDPIKRPDTFWLATYTELDGLRVNGEPWAALPRDAAWNGRTVYLCGAAPWLAIGARYLHTGKPADYLTAPWRGKPTGLVWTVDGGEAELVAADAWDLPANPCDAADELARLADALAWEESLGKSRATWRASASGLAADLARKTLGGKGGLLRQLRPRWRALARAAYHTGPQLALSGGSPRAVYVDRVAAYLQAMSAPLPVPGSWRSVQAGVSWEKLRRWPGFALATVQVQTRAALPPLPVRHVGGTVWPTGRFWGCWGIGWLRDAEKAGEATILRVHDAQICELSPWLEPLATRIDRVEDRKVRKLLYTRTYGLFAAQGRWIAPKPDALDPRRTVRRWDADHNPERWAWAFTGGEALGHDRQPLYRPDLAAAIAGHNAVAMVRAIRALPATAVHMAHVDSLMVDAEHAPAVLALGGWAVKGEAADLRVYGTGTYQHGPRCRAQGQPGAHDPATLAELVERGRVQLGAGESWRAWTHGGPYMSAQATSTPGPIRQAQTIRHLPTWRRDAWSVGNWCARGLEASEAQGKALELDADPDATAARRAWEHEERERAAQAAADAEAERLAIRAEYGPGADG